MSSKGFINLKNIDAFSLVKDILRDFWVVVIVGLIGVMVTYMQINSTFVPTYTSSAIYIVTPRQSTGYVYTNKRFAESVITVFQNLMNADIMKNRITDELHVDNLDANIQAELITETNLMKLTVTSEDPILSFEVIDVVMNNYAELSEYLTSDAVFDVLKEPVVASGSDNVLTPRRKSLEIGGLCALAALLLIAASSIFRQTIKTEAVIEEQFDTTLLGTVYHEKKNRTVKAKIVQSVKSLLITSPIVSRLFVESINNIRIKMEYEHERHPEKNVYLFSSVCENEGKSTISLNVALSLAKEGKKVIVIDADMRKPAIFKMLDIPRENTTDLIKLLQGECGLDEVLYRDKDLGLDLIMSNKGHTSTYEFMRSGAMKDLINKCSRMADYVILDTPPMAMVSDAEALLDKVDFSVLVVRQDFSYAKDVNNCLNIMNDASSKCLGCVLNNYTVFRMKYSGIHNMYNNESGKAVEIYDE